MNLIQSGGDYLLRDIFPGHQRESDAVLGLKEACNSLLNATSAADSENREELDKIKLQVVTALCEIEHVLPKTEFAIMFHVLVHVPDSIYRWNSVRNFWSFFGERCFLFRPHICNHVYIMLANLLSCQHTYHACLHPVDIMLTSLF